MSRETLFGTVLPIISFFVLGAVFSWLERSKPRRETNWRRTFGMDVLGLAVVWSCVPAITAATMALVERVKGGPPPWLNVPEAPRAFIYFVLADLSRYWVHRLMHLPTFWRTHLFHHSPNQLYWFSGNRATPVHVALFLSPQLFFGWLMAIRPEVVFANVFVGQVMNNVMHANWDPSHKWQRRLELLVTTPRYHAIHHAHDLALGNKNLAPFFTLWDRLFGTYVDPDTVDLARLEFGSDTESTPTYRMVTGA
jgi:sterol desaturase/sphingolipid hydroxylase (fatty acid hydroxylase superfamily)